MTEPPGPPGPPTKDPAANLAAFQGTDAQSDIEIAGGMMVVHPAAIDPEPCDVDLPDGEEEYADSNADLHVKLIGKMEASAGKLAAECDATIDVRNWFLSAMVLLLIGLVVAIAGGVVVMIAVPNTGLVTAAGCGLIAALFAAGLVGVVVHQCRRRWSRHHRR
jgi:hypothetical protein